MNERWARAWFGVTAAAVFGGIILQAILVANNSSGHFGTPSARVFNMFCFFTVDSNTIVGITSLLLAISRARTSTVFATLRLNRSSPLFRPDFGVEWRQAT